MRHTQIGILGSEAYPMRIITKRRLESDTGLQEIKMHGGNARIIHFGAQNGMLFVWAEEENGLPLEPHQLFLEVTGYPVPNGSHIGTVQVDNLVWHLYTVAGGG